MSTVRTAPRGTAHRPVGEETARVRRPHLVLGAPAFEERRTGADRIPGARPGPGGGSGTPTTPQGWRTGRGRL